MKKQKFQPLFLVNEVGKVISVQLDVRAYEVLIEVAEEAKRSLKAVRINTRGFKFDRDEANER